MNKLRDLIDRQLGIVSMYHVVVIGLVAISGWALVLMAAGELAYSPLAFIISIALCTGVSFGSNTLFGWLFGVRPHHESAVITGLILALLFTPPVGVLAGLKLALVAVIAMASKYVLAVRGKHLFNPAAIAIVIASVGQLAYASWWIATPALLPLTILAAGLILYKTQKVTMAVLFLGISITLLSIQTAFLGPLSLQALGAAITSWPLIFFAGVMLSEPQTLPPKRSQQYLVAAIVAVFVTMPLHYGTIVMMPALALIIGNILAFYFGTRRGIALRLIDKKPIGSNGHELLFDTKPFQFEPGQYMELSLPHGGMDRRGMRRVFSIIGRPYDEQVSIATRLPEPSSSFKRALVGMKKGQLVYATRVAGDFVLPKETSDPILFIAGGIGITPLISFLMAPGRRDITVLYAVSSVADIMFADVLRQYDIKVVIVTPDTAPLPDPAWLRQHGVITRELLTRYIQPDSHVYISGPPPMVTRAKRYAASLGARHIRTDHFKGY